MKITPVTMGVTNGGAMAEGQAAPRPDIRVLKMKTDVSPEQNLSIPDPVDPGVVEATQPLSPQFAALAKQKRALQLERQALEREKAERAQATTQVDAVPKARLKSDPLGVLLESGVTWDELTQAALAHNNGMNPELRALEAKIKAVEEGFQKNLSDREAQQEQQVIAEIKREASRLVAEGDDFEMVRATRRIPDVMRLIEQTYRKTGEVLGTREALQLVEDELIQESLKLAALKKVQSRLAPPPAPVQPPQTRFTRTLTNRDTASVPLSPKARAMAAFNGTLKR